MIKLCLIIIALACIPIAFVSLVFSFLLIKNGFTYAKEKVADFVYLHGWGKILIVVYVVSVNIAVGGYYLITYVMEQLKTP